jgi:hypothetical protein
MKQFIKDLWTAIQEVQTIRAKAIAAGHHWY